MRTPWFNSEIASIGDLVNVLDDQLQSICKKAINGQGDEFGFYDAAEHATGLGLVACQTIIAIVCGELGIGKASALSHGPVHSGGLTKIQIINHAANYWKHNNEWKLEKIDRRREAVMEAFESVGFPVGADYPLSGVLVELSAPHLASLKTVLKIVDDWKMAVIISQT